VSEVEISKEIRRAVDTGKVSFGYRACQKSLISGKGELVVVSSNLPANWKETLKQLADTEKKRFVEVPETGLELGSVCGKPFNISAMIVLEVGKSKVLETESKA
jgi:large subunit ribosomal protein L30e